jgi:hypothetical protein
MLILGNAFAGVTRFDDFEHGLGIGSGLSEPVRRRPAHARDRDRPSGRRRSRVRCFGLGLSLYFASQGAGRLVWPLLAGLLRMLLAVSGGRLAVAPTGSLLWCFAIVALALVTYGVTIVTAIASGAWFRH